MPPRLAFTLVELLVVITIIVILIALLAPALDKAVYAAEAAVCAAQQRTVIQGSVAYAFDHRRRFFHRPGVYQDTNTAVWRTTSLTDSPRAEPGRQRTYFIDDRPLMEPYFPVNILMDPNMQMQVWVPVE